VTIATGVVQKIDWGEDGRILKTRRAWGDLTHVCRFGKKLGKREKECCERRDWKKGRTEKEVERGVLYEPGAYLISVPRARKKLPMKKTASRLRQRFLPDAETKKTEN